MSSALRTVLAGVLTLAVVLLVFSVPRSTLLETIDDRILDILAGWAGPGDLSGQVVVVDIDEASLSQYGRWPWPRAILGACARRLLDAGARTVVLDMVLPEEDAAAAPANAPGLDVRYLSISPSAKERAQSNDVVFAALVADKPVVAGYWFGFERATEAQPTCLRPLPFAVIQPQNPSVLAFSNAKNVVCSTPRISAALAGGGFLNGLPDLDGKLRTLPLVIEFNGQQYPSLALAAFNAYRPVKSAQLSVDAQGATRIRWDGQIIPLEQAANARLRYRGPRHTFRYVSVADVVANRVPQDLLRDRIAVVGSSAPGLYDSVATPLDPSLPVVEVQATAIDNLLQGDFFSRPRGARLAEWLAALIGGAISILLFATIRSAWAALGTLSLLLAGWAGSAVLVSATGMLASPLALTTALGGNYCVLTLVRYLQERRKAEGTERALVTSQLAANEAIREREARYQRLVENINDAIIVDDLEGRLVFANRHFREWFQLGDRDVRDIVLEDYVAPEWREALRDRHNRRVRGEAVPASFEFQGIRPDGKGIWIDALVTLVLENGKIVGTQSALRDISSRKQLQAEYLQAQKMETVGRFAGGIAHDFNNLLTVILGYSELLRLTAGADENATANVEAIQTAAKRAAELTTRLLAFSRPQKMHSEATEMATVVDSLRSLIKRLAGEDVQVIYRLEANSGRVMADPAQINQVLMNLVVNARDAMPAGGTLIIECRAVDAPADTKSSQSHLEPGRYVLLEVTDTGIGMDDSVRAKIFEPFFTTKEPGKGTGLGLATVYNLVRQCDGLIEVESELGRGSTFRIFWPCAGASEKVSAERNVEVQDLRGSETVLLVEDQGLVRDLTKAVLESYGYRVFEASSGPDAVAFAEQYPDAIDLLVTDIVMPLMNGWKLAKKLKTLRPNMKVLYMSAYPGDSADEDKEEAASACFIAKPFTPGALAKRVRDALRGENASGNTSAAD